MKKILLFIVILETMFVAFVVYQFRLFPDLSFLQKNLEPIQKTVSATPTPTPIPLSKMEIVGWYASFDDDKADEALPKAIDSFDVFAPMFYRILPSSTLGPHRFPQRVFLESEAKERNIPIAPVLTDESDSVRVQRLLNNKEIQNKFIDDLVAEAKNNNFSGWSLDIENLKSSDRQAFSQFIKNAYTKLHANDLKLYVIVYAKEEGEKYDPALAHDYKTLARYADEIQIMAYNYNNDLTGPGGQAPLDWYRKVLGNAVKTIPREKILIGLSTHGYDWNGDEVTGLTYPEVIELLKKNNAQAIYNPQQSAQVAKFTDAKGTMHEVWFEDAETVTEKMKIARDEFGINKFAFWRTSAEDPMLWSEVEKYR